MSKTSAVVFISILLVGLVISLIVLNRQGDRVEIFDEPLAGETSDDSRRIKDPPTPPGDSGGKPDVNSGESASAEASRSEDESDPDAPSQKTFSSPDEAMAALAETAAKGDFEAFLKQVGSGAVSAKVRPEVKRIIETLRLDPEEPSQEISKSADSVRWSLNFQPAESGEHTPLYVDLAGARDREFYYEKVSLPLDLTAVKRASRANESPSTSKSDDTEETDSDQSPSTAPLAIGVADADALTVAHAFSRAVTMRDFEAARALSDPGLVTDERVAALMIAVEEGGFRLRKERPLVVTLSREDITWVLTRIQSDQGGSEFALELRRGEAWQVNGLTFSKVLSTLADRAGGGDVAYSPIAEDPSGGDSLVLYFEFDEADVTPRGRRQLAIIADILSQGEDRVIRINGHADALGTDLYNRGLSDSRAAAIREGLISMGVSPEQIVTEAYGESRPRKPNFLPDGTDNPTGRSQNRRAEVYLDF